MSEYRNSTDSSSGFDTRNEHNRTYIDEKENPITANHTHNFTRIGKMPGKNALPLLNLKAMVAKSFPNGRHIRIYNRDVPIDNMTFGQVEAMMEWERETTYTIPRQKTCGLVGNGGILLNSSCGNDINSNDFVIRFNIPEIEHFVKDVGLKTNLTLVNYELMKYLHRAAMRHANKLERLRSYQFLNDSILWYPGTLSHNIRRLALSNLKSKFHIPFRVAYTPTFSANTSFHLIKRLDPRHRLTAGINTIVAALSICDEVTIYGFYPRNYDASGRKLPYHYYGKFSNVTEDINSFKTPHNWEAEFKLLTVMQAHGIMKWVTSKCV
ncbi:CMP-N-acetylneuraminate-poly-alpha-2,8-sialyltransferase-like [Saccoglossus kowalevskii]|uniref:CMP-N-acetylneuraminate-poly-alpha-2, 8-sialyltransferase-like n=1 Tax=Saccoglossus kowalevskii TaxID=10224 RepID=A0ABM0MPQ1_SACKO|nr:PREDICTED: CMP-N-acetylneuraminate-poly-alpha-2,8-sialyltransferase-like [Saccoglossus kowalevskii]